MGKKNQFVDLQEQAKSKEEETAKKVRRSISNSLAVLTITTFVLLFICIMCGGTIQMGDVTITARSCFTGASVLAVAFMIVRNTGK